MEIKGTNTKNVNILERNNEGTNRNGQKKTYDEGTKRKKSPILKRNRDIRKK